MTSENRIAAYDLDEEEVRARWFDEPYRLPCCVNIGAPPRSHLHTPAELATMSRSDWIRQGAAEINEEGCWAELGRQWPSRLWGSDPFAVRSGVPPRPDRALWDVLCSIEPALREAARRQGPRNPSDADWLIACTLAEADLSEQFIVGVLHWNRRLRGERVTDAKTWRTARRAIAKAATR